MDLKLDEDMLDVAPEIRKIVEEQLSSNETKNQDEKIKKNYWDVLFDEFDKEANAIYAKWLKELVKGIGCFDFSHYIKKSKVESRYLYYDFYLNDNEEKMHIFPHETEAEENCVMRDDLFFADFIVSEALFDWLKNSQDYRVKGFILDVNKEGTKCKLDDVILFKRNTTFEDCLRGCRYWSFFDSCCKEINKSFTMKAIDFVGNIFGKTLGMSIKQEFTSDTHYLFNNVTALQEKDICFCGGQLYVPLFSNDSNKIAIILDNFLSIDDLFTLLEDGYVVSKSSWGRFDKQLFDELLRCEK